jgi:6,7-dimethyl-8-ribityllumazine synthase
VPGACGGLTGRREGEALARSRPGPDNKGAEAARAAVATVRAVRAVSGRGRRAQRRR